MEDLLKSIWAPEESQVVATSTGGEYGNVQCGNLQRQGSLILPQTHSQKTVDEAWRDVLDETMDDVKDGRCSGGSKLQLREPTLGEMTSEDFLFRAGVAKEDIRPSVILKSIWAPEESKVVATSTGGEDGNVQCGNLHRQGSLILPQTHSQKTVDEVWRDVVDETVDVKVGCCSGGSKLQPREPTLGEMTLEDFLFGAGVAKEDIRLSAISGGNGIYGSLPPASGNSAALNLGFQQPSQNNGVLGDQLASHSNMFHSSTNLWIDMSVLRSSQRQLQLPQSQSQPPLKQTNMAFSSSSQLGSNAQLFNPGIKGSVVGITKPVNSNRDQGGATTDIGGLHYSSAVARSYPRNHLSSDATFKSNIESLSLPPSLYNFGEGGQKKSSSYLEKVVERRQKRMIKNRESASRSRARKQAYTLELEAEVAKLRETNQELQKKQEEFKAMLKNQILESTLWGGKRRCLRRTLTSPL